MAQSMMQRLRELRAGKSNIPDVEEDPQLDVKQMRTLVDRDQALTQDQRTKTLAALDDPDFINELKSGAIGAALSLLIGKYMKLKPSNQLLLSLAGFGVGKIIYDYRHDPKRFSRYNAKLRMYEIQD